MIELLDLANIFDLLAIFFVAGQMQVQQQQNKLQTPKDATQGVKNTVEDGIKEILGVLKESLQQQNVREEKQKAYLHVRKHAGLDIDKICKNLDLDPGVFTAKTYSYLTPAFIKSVEEKMKTWTLGQKQDCFKLLSDINIVNNVGYIQSSSPVKYKYNDSEPPIEVTKRISGIVDKTNGKFGTPMSENAALEEKGIKEILGILKEGLRTQNAREDKQKAYLTIDTSELGNDLNVSKVCKSLGLDPGVFTAKTYSYLTPAFIKSVEEKMKTWTPEQKKDFFELLSHVKSVKEVGYIQSTEHVKYKTDASSWSTTTYESRVDAKIKSVVNKINKEITAPVSGDVALEEKGIKEILKVLKDGLSTQSTKESKQKAYLELDLSKLKDTGVLDGRAHEICRRLDIDYYAFSSINQQSLFRGIPHHTTFHPLTMSHIKSIEEKMQTWTPSQKKEFYELLSSIKTVNQVGYVASTTPMEYKNDASAPPVGVATRISNIAERVNREIGDASAQKQPVTTTATASPSAVLPPARPIPNG